MYYIRIYSGIVRAGIKGASAVYNADARVCSKMKKYRNLFSFLILEPYWQSIGLVWKQKYFITNMHPNINVYRQPKKKNISVLNQKVTLWVFVKP